MREKIHVIARAVIIDKNKILICKNLDFGIYFLPGGHVEYREDVKTSLIRELKEEIGYEFIIDKFLGCIENIFEDKRLCHDHEYNFIFKVSSNNFSYSTVLKQLEDHIELFWFDLDRLSELNIIPKSIINLILEWQNKDFNQALATEINYKLI